MFMLTLYVSTNIMLRQCVYVDRWAYSVGLLAKSEGRIVDGKGEYEQLNAKESDEVRQEEARLYCHH